MNDLDRQQPSHADKVRSFKSELLKRRAEMEAILPPHISFELFVSVVMTAIGSSPDLLTECTPASLFLACQEAAQDGLLPDGEQAVIVIRRNKVWRNGRPVKDGNGRDKWESNAVYMPMVRGITQKILETHEVTLFETGVIFEGDTFHNRLTHNGREFLYEQNLDVNRSDFDKIRAAFSFAKLANGELSVEVMTRSQLEQVRAKSDSGKDKDNSGPRGVWAEWYDEQARKSVARRHAKRLPKRSPTASFRDIEAERMFKVSAAPTADALPFQGQQSAPTLTQQPARPAISAPATTLPPIDMGIPDFGDATPAPVHTGQAMPEVDQRAERMPEPEPGMPIDEAEEQLRRCETIIDLQTRWAEIEGANEWTQEAYTHLNSVYAERERDLKRGR